MVRISDPVTSSRRRLGARRIVGAALCLLLSATAGAAQPVNPSGAATLEFQQRVKGYLDLRERAASKLPPLKETNTPADIEARGKALGSAVRAARQGALPGALFGPVTTTVRDAIKQDWSKRPAADRRALLEEMPRKLRLRVNQVYPEHLPLATFPSVLLEALPRIPEDLEYRFVGRHLVLYDDKANIIVDVVENVVPAS